jgi:hypothetical protein
MKPKKHAAADDISRAGAEVIGDLFGVSRVTFSKWCNDGIIERQAPAKGYDLRVVCRAVLAHYQRIAAGRGGEGGDALTRERVRLAAARAEREERLNAIEAGKVCKLAPVERFLKNEFLIMRTRMLNLPGELAYALADRPQDEIFHALDDRVREVLEWIADPDRAAKQAAAAGIKGNNAELDRGDHDDDEDEDAPDAA